MNHSLLRLTADYGGILNGGLCIVHCAAGPLLLALWGARAGTGPGPGDVLFLVVSGILIVGATWRMSAWWLRGALWGFFTLFALAMMLAVRYPGMQMVHYAASLGLIGTHLLNLRHARRVARAGATRVVKEKQRSHA